MNRFEQMLQTLGAMGHTRQASTPELVGAINFDTVPTEGVVLVRMNQDLVGPEQATEIMRTIMAKLAASGRPLNAQYIVMPDICTLEHAPEELLAKIGLQRIPEPDSAPAATATRH